MEPARLITYRGVILIKTKGLLVFFYIYWFTFKVYVECTCTIFDGCKARWMETHDGFEFLII